MGAREMYDQFKEAARRINPKFNRNTSSLRRLCTLLEGQLTGNVVPFSAQSAQAQYDDLQRQSPKDHVKYLPILGTLFDWWGSRNLFIEGHGFRCDHGALDFPVGGAPPPAHVRHRTVPVNIELIFYCKEGKLFDTHWMADILSSKALWPGYDPPIASVDWKIQRFKAGQDYKDHLLTRPGNMAISEPSLNNMTGIDTNVAAGCSVPANLVDGAKLAVKNKRAAANPGEPWTWLSAILTAVVAAGGAASPVRIHWCACRSPFNGQQATWNTVISQALDAAVAPRQEYHAPPRRKLDPKLLNPHNS